MKITVKKITDWDLVYEMALYTQGKIPTKQFPSEEWKRKTVKASHSILRCMQFMIYIEDVPSFIHSHLCRHIHSQPFIRTMREDLTGVPSNEITRNTPNNGCYMVNVQELLHIANQRNQQKREVCRNCLQTGKRGYPFGIKYFYEGSEDWDKTIVPKGKNAEKGCYGCGWYDVGEWRKQVLKKLLNNNDDK